MARIINFPHQEKAKPRRIRDEPQTQTTGVPSPLPVRVLWVVVVLLWPLLKWVMALDCIVQLLLAMYRWHTTPLLAVWTFAAHFGALCALTYFVAVYQPKGL